MSDVTVAQDMGGAPAPANEVPINQNQVSTPNPIGSQAPAPTGDIEGSKHRPESRREAIQKAFDRAVAGQNAKTERHKPAPKAAEAKAGHNNPPEDTPKEKLDLKKRPSEQPQPQPRERGDGGRFAPREPILPDREPYDASKVSQPAQTQQRPATSYRDPPARLSEEAKRDWATTPETVRGEIHRQQKEFAQAYNYYKDAHENFKPIQRYHEMAKQHGTTLEKALANYVSMEEKLRSDPLGGLDVIVQNLGLKRPDGSPADLRDVSYTVLSQSPDQIKAMQQSNVQSAANQQIGALHQQVARLESTLGKIQHQAQFTYTRSAIDQFALTHPRIDEDQFGTVVTNEIKLGYDLETAYRRAELLCPTTHAAQTRTTPAQTRPTDKSIHGSPASSNGAFKRSRPASRSTREAVENALRHANGI